MQDLLKQAWQAAFVLQYLVDIIQLQIEAAEVPAQLCGTKLALGVLPCTPQVGETPGSGWRYLQTPLQAGISPPSPRHVSATTASSFPQAPFPCPKGACLWVITMLGSAIIMKVFLGQMWR